jgi:hypothetical protein
MDPLRDASPGESTARLLKVDTFNLQMAAARWVRDHGRGAAARAGTGPAGADQVPNRLEVRVQATGTLPEYAVVRLGEALIDPAASPARALNTPVFGCSAPASASDFVAITTGPVEGGKVGRAVVSGVAVVSVEVTDAGHRYAAPVAGDLFKLKSAAAGPAYLLAPAGAGTYHTLVLLGAPPADSSGPAGCSWLANLDATLCLRVTVVSAGGSCSGVDASQERYLAWGGANWASASDFDCGAASGPVVFGIASGAPSLTLAGTAGVYLGCSGGKATFAFGNALCAGSGSGSGSGGGSSCTGGLVLAVECSCCPIAGWDGPGWYCCRDAGTADPCTPLHLADGDKCDATIEICSGPYASEAAAGFVCGPANPPGANCPDVAGLVSVGDSITGSLHNTNLGGVIKYYHMPITGGATYYFKKSASPGTWGVNTYWELRTTDQPDCTGLTVDLNSAMPDSFTASAGAKCLCLEFRTQDDDGVMNDTDFSFMVCLGSPCP